MQHALLWQALKKKTKTKLSLAEETDLLDHNYIATY